MNKDGYTKQARQIMLDFAGRTGLEPVREDPHRYLWTDAFAVCNYLGEFNRTQDILWRDLALRLVDQVHNTLGRHRKDDLREGWISGLPEKEGALHPTIGGLRIGKPLGEGKPGDPYDERLEWNRDGQYFHYLTKWMHALCQVSKVTGDPKYLGWALELAVTSYSAFSYRLQSGRKRMYWKMSIDLTRPRVHSMGQHDPLDGFITFNELQAAASATSLAGEKDIRQAIDDLAQICRGMSLETSDPLGTGGLLFDACRVTQLKKQREPAEDSGLLASILTAAREGLTSFERSGTLGYSAEHRLAFRELGLSLGLAGIGLIFGDSCENPGFSGRPDSARPETDSLIRFIPLRHKIERFWLDSQNQFASTWVEHQDINSVMLATSLAPEGFLVI
jgi:hypothetical protein